MFYSENHKILKYFIPLLMSEKEKHLLSSIALVSKYASTVDNTSNTAVWWAV
jgi:hypothetical protein